MKEKGLFFQKCRQYIFYVGLEEWQTVNIKLLEFVRYIYIEDITLLYTFLYFSRQSYITFIYFFFLYLFILELSTLSSLR